MRLWPPTSPGRTRLPRQGETAASLDTGHGPPGAPRAFQEPPASQDQSPPYSPSQGNLRTAKIPQSCHQEPVSSGKQPWPVEGRAGPRTWGISCRPHSHSAGPEHPKGHCEAVHLADLSPKAPRQGPAAACEGVAQLQMLLIFSFPETKPLPFLGQGSSPKRKREACRPTPRCP